MKVHLTDHAVLRYAERCKGIHDPTHVECVRFATELSRFMQQFGAFSGEAPDWFGLPPEEDAAERATHYMVIGDDVVLPLYRRGADYVAVTTITKGCISEVVRRARNAARQDRSKRKAHKRRMKQHHKMPRSDSQQ